MWRRFVDMLRRPDPDEREAQAKRLADLTREVRVTNADLRSARIRAEAVLAGQRLAGR